MATNTTNYNWTKPDYEDDADIKDLNDNFDGIDAQVKAIDDQVQLNKNNILSQQNTTAQGGQGYAIINGKRLYVGSAAMPERTGDIWLDGATARESEYLLSANPLCGIRGNKDTLNLSTGACTRQIKKLVLTGEENWNYSTSSQVHWIQNVPNDYDNTLISQITTLCSHYRCIGNNTGFTGMVNGDLRLYAKEDISPVHELYIKDTTYTSAVDFKAYLAQQYAAETPVTVWYILASPTTETITIPLGNVGTVEGYLTQSGTPAPTAPIYPTANEVLIWG